jgi:hypothetical protein
VTERARQRLSRGSSRIPAAPRAVEPEASATPRLQTATDDAHWRANPKRAYAPKAQQGWQVLVVERTRCPRANARGQRSVRVTRPPGIASPLIQP